MQTPTAKTMTLRLNGIASLFRCSVLGLLSSSFLAGLVGHGHSCFAFGFDECSNLNNSAPPAAASFGSRRFPHRTASA